MDSDSDSDSDSGPMDSDSHLMDSDSGLMDSDSDSDSGLLDSDSLPDSWVRTHSNTDIFSGAHPPFSKSWLHPWQQTTCRGYYYVCAWQVRGVASLAVPSDQAFHFPHFSQISVIFSHFSSNIRHFCIYSDPRGGQFTHPGKPWLRPLPQVSSLLYTNTISHIPTP